MHTHSLLLPLCRRLWCVSQMCVCLCAIFGMAVLWNIPTGTQTKRHIFILICVKKKCENQCILSQNISSVEMLQRNISLWLSEDCSLWQNWPRFVHFPPPHAFLIDPLCANITFSAKVFHFQRTCRAFKEKQSNHKTVMVWKKVVLIAIGKVSQNICFETVSRLYKKKKKTEPGKT